MHFDLEHIKELTGTLITLDNSAVILGVVIEVDAATSKKLASVLGKKM